MTIYDFVKPLKAFTRFDGEIGLEIETETKEPYKVPAFHYWHVHDDGSLRNFGKEYVLKQPVKFKTELNEALEEFHARTSNIPFIKDAYSTSVHVHLNFLNESFKTLGNFMTIYSMIENILIRFSGEDRRSNLFCLPIADAEETHRNLLNMFVGIEKKNYKSMFFPANSVKYAALNLGAFNNYGSFEFRSFRGETDINTIRIWISLLYKILEYSRQDINPKDIMLKYKEINVKILDEIFGDLIKHIDYKDKKELIEGTKNDPRRNIFYAGSIAYSIGKSWDKLDKKPEITTKPSAKELEALATKHLKKKISDCDPAEIDFLIATWTTQLHQKWASAAATGNFPEAGEVWGTTTPPPIPVGVRTIRPRTPDPILTRNHDDINTRMQNFFHDAIMPPEAQERDR